MVENNNQSLNVETREVQSWEQAITSERTYAPYVDIYETRDEFVLMANMPGASKENVRVKLENGALHIFGKVDYDNALRRKYLLKENQLGNYYRKFNISDSIDETKVEAGYENGQLTVKLPKHDRVKPRIIDIK